jgi:hypothetical protein
MQGYKVLKNVIPSTYLKVAQKETLRLKTWLLENNLVGTRSELGTGTYWRGIETASRLSRPLKQMYESPFMLELAREELGDTFYMYNDQVVVKMPKEQFAFEPHRDNQYGQDPTGKFKTLNFTWILDDQKDIRVMDGMVWIQPELEAGDILILDGNQIHCSGYNNTEKPRRNWCCVYSKEKPNYMDFYSEKVSFIS